MATGRHGGEADGTVGVIGAQCALVGCGAVTAILAHSVAHRSDNDASRRSPDSRNVIIPGSLCVVGLGGEVAGKQASLLGRRPLQ